MAAVIQNYEEHVWTDIYHGLVQKCVISPGAGKLAADDDTLKLILTMYIIENEIIFLPNRMTLRWRYDHTNTSPLIKSLVDIMPMGLRKAVSTMYTGEKALIWIHPLMAYGSAGFVYEDNKNPQESIPPGTALLFEVYLVSLAASELKAELESVIGRTNRFETISGISKKLVEVKLQFTQGQRKVGLQLLIQMIRSLDRMRLDPVKEPRQEKERRSALLDTLILASESALEIGWYSLAVTFGRRVIETIPLNAAANYVLSRAYFALGFNRCAKQYAMLATCNDILIDKYKQHFYRIQRHMALVDESLEVEEEDEFEIHEKQAQIILQRWEEPEVQKKVMRDLNKLMRVISAESGTLRIEGGFSHEFLVKIAKRIKNPCALVKFLGPTSMEVDILI